MLTGALRRAGSGLGERAGGSVVVGVIAFAGFGAGTLVALISGYLASGLVEHWIEDAIGYPLSAALGWGFGGAIGGLLAGASLKLADAILPSYP